MSKIEKQSFGKMDRWAKSRIIYFSKFKWYQVLIINYGGIIKKNYSSR